MKIAYCCSAFGDFFRKFADKSRGAVLLEVAIAVAILGIVSGFALKKSIAVQKIARAKITKENIEIIAVALAAHVAKHSRLPKPSAGSDGEESSPGAIGFVPFKALNIPQKISLDGNAKPLTYVVELKLTTTNMMHGSGDEYFCRTTITPSIKIQNYAEDIIAFVLDSTDNPAQIAEGQIEITPKENTYWVSRNMLLIKFLKDQPCINHPASVNTPNGNNSELNEFSEFEIN